MVKYYLRKLLIFGLSMAIAVCVAVLSFSILSIALFHGDIYIRSGLEKNSAAIIERANEDLEEAAESLSLPPELLTSVLDEQSVKVICSDVAKNFVYGYSTSFASSSELYNVFSNYITEHDSDYSLNLSDAEINRISSYAVDVVDSSLGSSDTAKVDFFNFVRSQKMMITIIFCILMTIASIIALDMMNNGRHRKFNYIGMGLATAGAINIASAITVFLSGSLKAYKFCSFDAYNSAIYYCFATVFNLLFVIGVILFAVGFIMLLNTFLYFKTKKEVHAASKIIGDESLTDYMDNYNVRSAPRKKPGVEFEKDVKKIDFEED